MQYYIFIDGQQRGPYEVHELRANGLTPETPVWSQDMTDWVRASLVNELQPLFAQQTHSSCVPPVGTTYFAQINGMQYGPLSVEQLLGMGLNANTLVWTEGWPQWVPAAQVAEFAARVQPVAPAPGSYPRPMQQMPQEGSPAPSRMALSIITLVLGLFSFIGLILGIIAVVYSGKVNSANSQQRYADARSYSSTAFTLGIIGLVLDLLSIGFIGLSFFAALPFLI